MGRIDLVTRLRALEARKPATSDDWRERLARYKRWFEDGEEWVGDPRPMRKRPILPGTSDISMIYRGQKMKNSQLERRLSVMEARYNIDHARDEAAEVRHFLDRLSDQELNRCAEIAERSGRAEFCG